MTEFERLIQRVQARRVAMSYAARGLDLPRHVFRLCAHLSHGMGDAPQSHQSLVIRSRFRRALFAIGS